MNAQDSTKQVVDTLTMVQSITHGKFNVFESYFFHLAKNPERIDSLLMWGICTLAIWILLFAFRKVMIAGLRGTNAMWEGGEQVTYFSIWAFFPVLFRIAFFQTSSTTQVTGLYIVTGIIAYQVFGRYIFDWALAFKGGLSSVPPVVEPKPAPNVTVNVDQSPKP